MSTSEEVTEEIKTENDSQEKANENLEKSDIETEEVKDSKEIENESTCESEDNLQAESDEDSKEDSENIEEDSKEDSEGKSEEDSEDSDSKKDKSFKGRREKKKIEELKKQINELKEARLRQLAEFDNFRKRTENEKGQMFEMGAKSVIEKILPVVDSFERGLLQVPENEESKSFVEGMELIYKQMMKAFDELDVKPIDACGKEFNPDLHNAVMAVDDDEKESGTVAEELQKGYTYKDSVVRHSMVKVVN